ncbi:pilus assembly protein [Granulosicoccaceae sp. 1_MG-2023]|nr:pilus assembly protein [Granulosicoccaceae sp. 1_MG-2023]
MRRLRRTEGGFAVLEFAAMLPFMFLMIVIVAEVARAFYDYTTLHKITQTGARYASEHILNSLQLPDLSSELQADVARLVVTGSLKDDPEEPALLEGLSTDDVTVSSRVLGFYEPHVEVHVSWQFRPLFSDFSLLSEDSPFRTGFTMESRIIMRAM